MMTGMVRYTVPIAISKLIAIKNQRQIKMDEIHIFTNREDSFLDRDILFTSFCEGFDYIQENIENIRQDEKLVLVNFETGETQIYHIQINILPIHFDLCE